MRPRLVRSILASSLSLSFSAGTTLAECKSGYGLDAANEVKMLRVLEAAKEKANLEISSTFCGAHTVPK